MKSKMTIGVSKSRAFQSYRLEEEFEFEYNTQDEFNEEYIRRKNILRDLVNKALNFDEDVKAKFNK